MPRFFKTHGKKAGTAPGTLVHVGERKIEETRITVMDYDVEHLAERRVDRIEEVFPLRDRPTVTWINIDGVHDTALMQTIGKHFGIHPLTLEDILNTGHRPKQESFENYLYIVVKMLDVDERTHEASSEQVSIVLGDRYLLSFQERTGDVFTAVRDRVRRGRGRIRSSGCDYLAYALLDAVVDQYFLILEEAGDAAEELEEELLTDPDARILEKLHDLKRNMIYMRKQVWPMRELVGGLTKETVSPLQEETRFFLSDVYDHIVQITDTIESYRDLLNGMVDLYMSMAGHKMNEVMKLLTIVATIFIPVTFVAGIYGMNFAFMPELQWRYGYAAVWAVMILVVAGLLLFFKKKKWI
jgi:magnesium transporter